MESQSSVTSPTGAGTPVPTSLVAGGVSMLVLAVMLISCGLCSGLAYLVFPLIARQVSTGLEMNVVMGAAAGFGILFGLVLVWQGVQTLRGRVSVPAARVFPPLWAFAFAYFCAIIAGLGALALAPLTSYALPPLHFIAASVPPLALLAYAAHRLGNHSGFRALVATLSWGALAATSLAFLLEAVSGLALILLAVLLVAAQPNGREILDQMQGLLAAAQRTGDWAPLSKWMSQPAVMAGFVFYFALLVPPMEELVKTLVVAFIDPRRTRAADALLWGMGAGAGFAIAENLFNAAVTLADWGPVMLLRAGASVIHVTNGALMGRGWYAARVERRWGSLFSALIASVVLHALWNAAALFLSAAAPEGIASSSLSLTPTVQTGALLLFLVLLAAAGLGWIGHSVRAALKANAAPGTEPSFGLERNE